MFKFLQKSILLITFSLLCYQQSLFGQGLTQSRQTSYYTFVYQITNEEAQRIFKDKVPYQDTTMFHSLIEMFPTDSTFKKKLPRGHYLFVHAEDNELVYELASIHDVQFKILDNKKDFVIVLTDSLGNHIPDAEVKLKSRKIPYDTKTQNYRLKKTNKSGLLSITYQGFTSYHSITKRYKNSRFKRIKNSIVYRSPLKWVLLPFRWIYAGFRDIYHGIKRWRVPYFMQRIGGWFRQRNSYAFTNKHKGFIAFNKPKYKPGDTVRFKAMIHTQKGKPIKKTLEVNIGYNKKKLDIAPYRPGAYEGSFVLTDGLNLRLDQSHRIEFNKKRKNPYKDDLVYIEDYFRYEDYELNENAYTLRLTTSKKHFYPKEQIAVLLEGKDANDLNILDAKAELVLMVNNSSDYVKERGFIKDTLWHFTQKLDELGETKVTIPDSIFPQAALNLQLQAIFTNSSQERQFKTVDFTYSPAQVYLDLKLEGDSLKASYINQGISASNTGYLTVITADQKQYHKQVALPYQEKINPYFVSYELEVDSLKESLDITSSANIACLTERTADSIKIQIQNPRKLPFWYGIYRKNQLIQEGYDTTLHFTKKDKSAQKYFVSLQYIWGGRAREQEYFIPLNTNQLNIQVIQPSRIYPGERVKIDVLVTDYQNKPVANADLTAYAITQKFKNTNPPTIPTFEKSRKGRTLYNQFSKNSSPLRPQKETLNWQHWNTQMQLDSIIFFQFLYPENGLFLHEQALPDSVTQFAPFVVRQWGLNPVHIIELDGYPIYFSETNVDYPYSFAADSGYHHIRLRTAYKQIDIDSVYFRPGHKLTLSIDPNKSHPRVKVSFKKNKLEPNEIRRITNHLMPVRSDFGESMAYIEQGNQVQWINASQLGWANNNRRYSYRNRDQIKLAGPFRKQITKFVLKDAYETDFEFDLGFEYEFKKELLKMRSSEYKLRHYLNSSGITKNKIYDEAHTVSKLDSIWAYILKEREIKQEKYPVPKFTQAGNGRLFIDYKPIDSIALLDSYLRNILILKDDISDFIRVYPGASRLMQDLSPDQYKLLFLMNDGAYYEVDSVDIQADGLNYIRVAPEKLFPADSFSQGALDIILKQNYLDKIKDQEQFEIKKLYNQSMSFNYSHFNKQIMGEVLDAKDGVGIPGIGVIVKGSTIGTITNQDGKYLLNVPSGSTLVFQAIGYVTQEVNVGNASVIDVLMIEAVKELGEVVVIGYGVQEKSNLTGSVSSVNATAPQGRVAGIAVTNASGIPGAGISIRGVDSKSADQKPLIILDGVPYEGELFDLNPEQLEDMTVLRGTAAESLYGERGVNGVVIIQTGAKTPRQIQQAQENDPLNYLNAQQGSLRNNFSDYAYWQPKLRTDRNGKASFEVTFPDDITQWKGAFLASDGKKMTGSTTTQIAAYKDLSGSLALPRFLIEGDETQAIGKVLNYLPDTMEVHTFFEINGEQSMQKQYQVANAQIDSLLIQANSKDSLEVKYYLQKTEGYTDGELRKIPVLPKGSLETQGKFMVLDSDTTFTLPLDFAPGKVNLTATANQLDILEEEIRYVRNYRHLCNEQIASKIKCLIAQQRIQEHLGNKFKYKRDIQKLIRKLEKTQKAEGSWGWWSESPAESWITQHVLEAFLEAKNAGYKVQYNEYRLKNYLKEDLEVLKPSKKIDFLLMLYKLDSKVNFTGFIKKIEQDSLFQHGSLLDKLRVIALKQKLGMPYALDTLSKYRQSTLFGNYYWGEESMHPCDNPLNTTLWAYRIYKNDEDSEATLRKIRNYFLENRALGYWRNTYTASLIVEALLPDLLDANQKLSLPKLTLSGAINQQLTKFPYTTTIESKQSLNITKSGKAPVYLSLSQQFWNANPEKVEKDLVVNTYFKDSVDMLKKGKSIELWVEVEVKKSADYLYLEVPIPAGCTYDRKPKSYLNNEVYREYFQHETRIFCDRLAPGKYQFMIPLLPRYSGKYTLNPAKIEQMYFPVFFGRNEIKSIQVK